MTPSAMRRRQESRARASSVSLLPVEDAREAALFFVVAALCFLAALGGLAARSGLAAAERWSAQVAGQATLRVRGDAEAADLAARIAKDSPGVASARALSQSEIVALLEPWLGDGGALDELPLPQLVAVEATPTPGAGAEAIGPELSRALEAAGLDVSLVDHVAWSREARSAGEVAVFAALGALAILAATAVAVIAFATHSTLLTRREMVELLHLSGASDRYISALFERRFMMLGVKAGAAGALLAFGAAAFILFMLREGRDAAWLAPHLSLSPADGLILGLTPLAAGLSAMLAAKATVSRALLKLL